MLSRMQLAPCHSAPARQCAFKHCVAVAAVETPATSPTSSTGRQRRRRSTQRNTQQLPQLLPLPHLQPRHDTSTATDPNTNGAAAQQDLQQQTRHFLVPIKPHPQQQSMPKQQLPEQSSDVPSANPIAQQHTGKQATHAAGGSGSDAAATGKPAWALAVDKRVAALPGAGTRSARTARWSRRAAPGRQAIDVAASRQGADIGSSSSFTSDPNSRAAPAGSLLAHSSISGLLQGGELDAEGEQQLCLAYQRYVQLQQIMADPRQAQQVLQQAAQGHQQQQQQHGAGAAGPGLPDPAALQALLQDSGSIQREGLMAREMLLQSYEPLLINRVRRVQRRHTDSRELMAAARQGLLKAAARFDLQRVTRGRDRLYALADNYIRNALRDVLTEYQTAVVHVPTHVREVAAKLYRVEQQLRQKSPGKDPSVDDVAAAAGVSLAHAQQALQATGGALQAMSLQSSADQAKEERGKAGSGMDLQQIDVSTEQDSHELSGVVGAGGLAAARSGLHEELDAAAEQAAVTELLQGLMDKLDSQDRQLLQLKLDGGNVSQAARELGRSKQWGSIAVDKVVKKLREDVQQHAMHNTEVAELLRSQ